MACTVAVEEVITQHYNDQLREVIEKLPEDAELRQVCLHSLIVGVSGFHSRSRSPSYSALMYVSSDFHQFFKVDKSIFFSFDISGIERIS